jgi:hypothetical protein
MCLHPCACTDRDADVLIVISDCSLRLTVAYVRYDKASSAALAIESLNGATLNNGRGPKLKVLLAEAPSARWVVQDGVMMGFGAATAERHARIQADAQR